MHGTGYNIKIWWVGAVHGEAPRCTGGSMGPSTCDCSGFPIPDMDVAWCGNKINAAVEGTLDRPRASPGACTVDDGVAAAQRNFPDGPQRN